MSARVNKATEPNDQHSSNQMSYNGYSHGSSCRTLVKNKSGTAASTIDNGEMDGNSTLPRSIKNGARPQHFHSQGVTSDLILSEELLTELRGEDAPERSATHTDFLRHSVPPETGWVSRSASGKRRRVAGRHNQVGSHPHAKSTELE